MRCLCLVLVLAACGDDGTNTPAVDGGLDGSGDAAIGIDAGPPALTIASTGRVRLRAGDSGTLTVTLGGAVMGATTLRATSMPTGVTIEPMTVSAAGAVELVVTAGAAAMPTTMTTTIVATDDDDARTAQAMADVGVIGVAGTLDVTYNGDGQLDVVMPSSVAKVIAFEDDYDFFTVEQGDTVRRRQATGGAIDATWTQEGLLDVLGTRLLAVPGNRLAIQRSYFSGNSVGGDLSLHDATGHRVWRSEQPTNIWDSRFANGALYIHSENNGPTGYIKTLSLTGTLGPLVTGDTLMLGSYGDLQVDGAGRVVVSGSRSPRAGVGRFTTAGAPDATFGTDGVFEITSPLTGGAGLSSTVLVVAPTGEGYALVYFSGTGGGRSYLVPFSASGVAGALIPVTTQHADSYAALVRLQSDGKILVGGNDAGAGFVRRYLASGQLDSTFANAGTLALPYVPDELTVFAADDRLMVSMIQQVTNGGTIHLARVWL